MQVRTPLDLGVIIRERRRALGLRQQDLAERVGVSRQWIVEVERGKSRAELGLVLRTLNALGIELHVGRPEENPMDQAPPVPAIDIDEVIARARGRDA